MAIKTAAEARSAVHGEKMIELSVRFWTDEIASAKGAIIPKHAWAAGVVRAVRNESHGIVPGKPVPFNSLLDMPRAIEKVLLAQGIVLHPENQMKKYFAVE